MKVLFVATYGDFLATFEYSNIRLWQSLGCDVHCVANFSSKDYNRKIDNLKEIGVSFHEVAFLRKPLKAQNIKSYKALVRIIQTEQIDIVDCHNAIVSVFARLAASYCKIKYVIYTAHGFAFYNGCKSKSAKIFSVVEQIMARKTDLLITINNEDFETANHKMHVRDKAIYIPGVGLDTNKFMELPNRKAEYCKEFAIPSSAKVFLMVGELISRKNYETALRAFANVSQNNCWFVICGIGELENRLNHLCEKLKIQNRVVFAGYRTDVALLMHSFDFFVFPSFQEGLPVALMEAMAAGMPCVVSDIRGNRDLIVCGKGGYRFLPDDVNQLTAYMEKLLSDVDLNPKFGRFNEEAIKTYDISNVQRLMKQEYSSVLNKITM